MTPTKRGRAAGKRSQRHPRRAQAAAIQALEARRLLSLTIQLETPAGATSATVTAGEALQLNVIAIVTGSDRVAGDDALQDVTGSFLSTGLASGAIAGNLTAGNVAPFNANAQAGKPQDLNGDGNVDVGSNTIGSPDLFFARAGSRQTAGTVSGPSLVFQIGTLTYTVSSLGSGGQTSINFRPEDTSSNPAAIAAIWYENRFSTNEHSSPFRGGTPFQVRSAATPATGTVTATAYVDANGNAAQDAGEAAQADVALYVDVKGTGAYDGGDPSALTDATGAATITGVPAGAYTVREVAPLAFTQSQPASAGGSPVTVAAGGTVAAGAFGNEPDGSVAGTAYVDANGNGVQDAGEANQAAGTVVYLDVNRDGTLDAGDVTANVGTTGTFAFADVAPGAYTLRQVLNAGVTQTQPAGGGYAITVAPGQAVTGEAFGITPVGTVTGLVFTDANRNGVQDAGEAGLANVAVYLDVNHDNTDDAGDISALTGGTGAFTLADVAPGSYTLQDAVPTGDVQTVPAVGNGIAVTVTQGGTTTATFGVASATTPIPTPTPTGTGTITGTAYVDANGNGVDDAGDGPRAGASVYLDLDGSGTETTGDTVVAAAADGTFTFASVASGTYTLREVVPAGDAETQPNTGSYSVTVTAGGTVSGQDFGVQATPTPVPTPLPPSPLGVTVLTAPPSRGVIGGTVATARVRVTNTTAAAFTGPVTVSVYASADPTLAADAVPAGSAPAKTLKLRPGRSAVVAVRFTYPATLAGGTYQLVGSATATGTGTAPATGTAPRTVAIAPPTANLTVAIAAPAAGVAVRAGRPVSVPVRLTNAGNVAAVGTVTVTVYATTTGTVDATAVQLGTVPGRRVKIGARRAGVVPVRFTAPTALAAGSFQLIAVLNASTTPADDAADDTSAAVGTR